MSTIKTAPSPRFGSKRFGILRTGFFVDITFRREFYLICNFYEGAGNKTFMLPKIL